jgi:hypothetical protein
MHAFFYSPSRLPHTYVTWIQRLARLDERLLNALRQARFGNFIYGKDTGIDRLLGPMCEELGMPEVWGNPAKTIPLPCELVHQGTGPNCEYHALSRFLHGLAMAMGVYAPLQAAMLTRRLVRLRATKRLSRLNVVFAIRAAVLDALRNSSFLGAFIALFYYGVCLTRTRLGPKLFDKETVTPLMYERGLCILGGCAMCGWSVLIEPPRRQTELALFVLPRAVSVWVPRRYERKVRSILHPQC